MAVPPQPPQGAAVRVSVIIPTINEAEGIGKVLDGIPPMQGLEVLVVDGNSTDGTQQIAEGRGARVITEPRKGYGRAYRTGFDQAQGTFIATLDGDCTYPAERIPALIAQLEAEHLDFITGDRLAQLRPEAMSGKHRLGNWLLSTTMRVLHRVKVHDSQSGMWVFRRSILARIELTADGMPLSEEIKIECFKRPGIAAKEVPIDYRIREGEVKLASWADGKRNLLFLFSKRVRPIPKERR